MPRDINGEIYFSLREAAAKRFVPLTTMWRRVRDAELGITQLDVYREGNLRFISQRSLRGLFESEQAAYERPLPREQRKRRGQVRTATRIYRNSEASEFLSCFISYSHMDQSFAFRLHDTLQANGIRCWLDAKHLLPGDDMFEQVERGIRSLDKMLLCCSKHSLASWWVDNEISLAFDKEQQLTREQGRRVLVLIPLNLDGFLLSGTWKSGKATQVKQRLAADFTGWQEDNEKFEQTVGILLRALRADEAGREP